MSLTEVHFLPNMFILLFLLPGIIECNSEKQHPGWLFFNCEECGDVGVEVRIIRGKPSLLGQFPWMARLGYKQEDNRTRFRCGGSLINPDYVLTAGHCIYGFEKELHIIRLGENFLNTTKDCNGKTCSPPVQDIGIEKMHLHKHFNRTMALNDIGLIRLVKQAEYNDFVKPICLPTGDILKKSFIAQYVDIAGWGVTDSDSLKEADTLLYVTLPVRDNCACSHIVPGGVVHPTQFCVGLEDGEDSCLGDSGGPMMKMEDVMDARKYVLLGVVSVGKNYCGEAPAVYTNVMKYLDWILETVCKDELPMMKYFDYL